VKETKPKLTHGGRRNGSGRPRVDTVPKMYKLEPRVIEAVKAIAQQQNLTESAVVNELLCKAIIVISHPE
jgi:hypothetical protein